MKSNGVQILNEKKHCVCTSTLNSTDTVQVYDSFNTRASKSLTKQLGSLLYTQPEPDAITNHAESSQIQKGISDCGLISIATATSLCHGVPPNDTTLEQSAMRSQLIQCFEKGEVTHFLDELEL